MSAASSFKPRALPTMRGRVLVAAVVFSLACYALGAAIIYKLARAL